MTTIVWIIVVLICLAGGIWLGRYTAPGVEKARALEQERDEARAELQRYREDVRNHFEKTAHLFNQVTTGYRQLYEHLAEGSERLGTGENARMLENRPEDRTLQTPDDAAGEAESGSSGESPTQERSEESPATGATATAAAAGTAGAATAASETGAGAGSTASADAGQPERPDEDAQPRQATDYASAGDAGTGEPEREAATEKTTEEGDEAASVTEKRSDKN